MCVTTTSPAPIRRAAGQAGFTIVEVMVAAVVLIVGLFGVVALLDGSTTATATANQRVAATNLTRELLETARGLDYDELAPALLDPGLVAHGLGEGTPLTIERRGVTYTVTSTVCTYDAPADGLAAPAPSNVCTPQPAGAAGDSNGDDFRRVTFEVSWSDRSANARSVDQSELIVNPTGGLGPRLTGISPLTQTLTGNVSSAAVTYTTTPAAAVHWHADDGQSEGNAIGPTGSPQVWRVEWPIGDSGSGSEVLDGAYQIIAQPFDDRGVAGDAKLTTVVINRRKPYAPPSLAGGHDTRDGHWVDLSWELNSERDILGYRVHWAGMDGAAGNGDDNQVCPAAAAPAMLSPTTSSCTDPSPPSTGALGYYVVALARDGSGALEDGDATSLTISAAGSQPAAPDGPLTATTEANLPALSWNAPQNGSPIFYRIYRDGTQLADRYDRTAGTAAAWSDDDPDGGSHQYWVSVVNSHYNESELLGPVSWPP